MPVTIDVASQIELRRAIFQVSNDFATDGVVAHDYVINILSPPEGWITLTHLLPVIRGDGVHTITINGNGHTIDAASIGRVFLIDSGRVEIKNVVIANVPPQSDDGGLVADGFRVCADGTVAVHPGSIVSLSGVTVERAATANGDNSRRRSHWGPSVRPGIQASIPSSRDFAIAAAADWRG